MGRIAVELGRSLSLPEDELSDLYLAGLLHDVGKIGIRDAVLCKRDALTTEELEHLRQHVIHGADIFVTLDQDDFIRGGKQERLRLRGIWVLVPAEATRLLSALYGWDAGVFGAASSPR